MSTTVFISGANRGIGLGLAQAYASKEGYTVIVALRKPDSMPTVNISSGSKLVIVKLDAGDINDPKNCAILLTQLLLYSSFQAIEEIKKQGVDKLDIVIANAAIGDCFGALSEVDLGNFEEHWRINVLAPLALFQACVPLIPKGGKFIWMSSGASIIDRVPDKLDAGYGITKCCMNYLARYAHYENPDIVSFSLSPGWVQTDMGDRGARWAGMEKAPITVDESVAGITKVIDEANNDNYSGLHMRYDGSKSKW